jgi:PKHD-type hydroxylase
MVVHVKDDTLNPEFLDYVESIFKELPDQDGLVGNDRGEDNSTVRRSTVKITYDSNISNHLWTSVAEVNAQFYGYDIWNNAILQYTEYHGSNKGHYDWHEDDGFASCLDKKSVRKMSLSLQLSNPEEYEGGNFEASGIDITQDIKKRGTLIIFPSWVPHRVTPVTKGTRKTLVAWFSGPSWR